MSFVPKKRPFFSSRCRSRRPNLNFHTAKWCRRRIYLKTEKGFISVRDVLLQISAVMCSAFRVASEKLIRAEANNKKKKKKKMKKFSFDPTDILIVLRPNDDVNSTTEKTCYGYNSHHHHHHLIIFFLCHNLYSSYATSYDVWRRIHIPHDFNFSCIFYVFNQIFSSYPSYIPFSRFRSCIRSKRIPEFTSKKSFSCSPVRFFLLH